MKELKVGQKARVLDNSLNIFAVGQTVVFKEMREPDEWLFYVFEGKMLDSEVPITITQLMNEDEFELIGEDGS